LRWLPSALCPFGKSGELEHAAHPDELDLKEQEHYDWRM
jgi:hypothetical protein